MGSKKVIPRKFLKWCKKHFKDDTDKIDILAEYDSSLTIEENKTLFKEKFFTYFKEEVKLTKTEVLQKEKESLLIDNINRFQERFNIPIEFVQ